MESLKGLSQLSKENRKKNGKWSRKRQIKKKKKTDLRDEYKSRIRRRLVLLRPTNDEGQEATKMRMQRERAERTRILAR